MKTTHTDLVNVSTCDRSDGTSDRYIVRVERTEYGDGGYAESISVSGEPSGVDSTD